MGNTQFFQKIIGDESNISYKDILSESFKKHSMKDIEYALSAGNVYNHADSHSMLEKWHKPWLWFYTFCAFFTVSFALYLFTSWFPNIPSFGWTSIIFATLVTPFPFMILLWELNIPRNISFLSLAGYFVTGGILSIFFSAVLINAGVTGDAWMAPFAEEPGKLLASWVFLELINKKGKKIYGCTGLVIGAGVGTGFTVFETFGYAFNELTQAAEYYSNAYRLPIRACINPAVPSALYVVFVRSVPCLAAHLIYCVPYVAALTLSYHKSHSWEKSFKDRVFFKYFVTSILLHALWNFFGGIAGLTGWIIRIAIASGSFFALVQMIQLCLAQIIKECGPVNVMGRPSLSGIMISAYFNNTLLKGMTRVSNGEPIIVGRDSSVCSFCYPENMQGISRRHCRIFNYGQVWFVQDTGSTYGTYILGKHFLSVKKIAPGKSVKLTHGDRIYLGSDKVMITVYFPT